MNCTYVFHDIFFGRLRVFSALWLVLTYFMPFSLLAGWEFLCLWLIFTQIMISWYFCIGRLRFSLLLIGHYKFYIIFFIGRLRVFSALHVSCHFFIGRLRISLPYEWSFHLWCYFLLTGGRRPCWAGSECLPKSECHIFQIFSDLSEYSDSSEGLDFSSEKSSDNYLCEAASPRDEEKICCPTLDSDLKQYYVNR